MPDAKWLNETNVKAALSDTSLEIETIDRALVRRYTQMFRFGQFERPYEPGEIDAQANGADARRIGSQIAVLLKNDAGCCRWTPDAGSIVIIGQSAFVDEACLGGGGSSKVTPLYTVPPLDGMRDVLRDLGSSATVTKVTVADDLSNLDEAKKAAADADVVVLMAGLVATEGADQPDANMLNDQNRMLAELLGINPTTVVVLKDGNPVLMPWIDDAPAVLEVWNQGTEDGHVVADLLFGVVNPSGKVPTSYPRSEDDTLYAGRPERYPGTDEGDGYPVIRYSEGLEIGYRWFQGQGIQPLFGFGFGLSYTTFDIGDVSVDAPDGANAVVTVSASVTNTGSRGRRRGRAGVSRSARGGTAAEAACRVPEGLRGAGGVQAGDGHHRPGRDQSPVQRLGLLHAQIRDQAGGVHRLRRQLRRQHATCRHDHRPVRLSPAAKAIGTSYTLSLGRRDGRRDQPGSAIGAMKAAVGIGLAVFIVGRGPPGRRRSRPGRSY